jgi:hypothetical protein
VGARPAVRRRSTLIWAADLGFPGQACRSWRGHLDVNEPHARHHSRPWDVHMRCVWWMDWLMAPPQVEAIMRLAPTAVYAICLQTPHSKCPARVLRMMCASSVSSSPAPACAPLPRLARELLVGSTSGHLVTAIAAPRATHARTLTAKSCSSLASEYRKSAWPRRLPNDFATASARSLPSQWCTSPSSAARVADRWAFTFTTGGGAPWSRTNW